MLKIKLLDTRFLEKLTDDFSVWQHSGVSGPQKEHGYALDDAARALLVAIRYKKEFLVAIYLEFIRHACCDFSSPINFFSGEREPLTRPYSPDALGQVLWAVDEAVISGCNPTVVSNIKKKVEPYVKVSQDLRAHAYASLAQTDQWHKRWLSKQVMLGLKTHQEPHWLWPENKLHYGNAILAMAMLQSPDGREMGLNMLSFLNKICTVNRTPIAIGNKGWYEKNRQLTLHDQQPIDPAYQVMANITAYQVTSNPNYLLEAKRFFSWFWGNNLAKLPMVDPVEHSCADGLEETAVSKNKGAESIICYLLAQDAITSSERL